MAAIGKIRSWGPTLVVVIGLALFAFIAEELFRSCQATSNEQRQQVGQVLGKKLSVQEFNDLVEEHQEMLKFNDNNRENFTDEELNQIKDEVWQKFVMNTIIEDECEKLGLTVTREEMQNLFTEGTNPMLMNTPFYNQQTRRFDVAYLTKFLNDYKSLKEQGGQAAEQYTRLYNYWMYVEKEIRSNLLFAKYRALLSSCMLSNPVAEEASFNDQNIESSIVLGSLAYNSINDNDIEVSDAEMKAKYNELKERFKELDESRDIKYVRYQVVASDSDRADLMKAMVEAQNALANGVAPAEVNRKAKSLVPYNGFAVTRSAFSTDIAGRIDSMQVGQTSAPFETRMDNTLNVVKLIAKTQMPDSIEYRAIRVGGETLEAAHTTADSIYQALKGGAVFDSIAHKYGQDGSKQWLTSQMYQSMNVVDADSKSFIEALTNGAVGDLKNLQLAQGNVVLEVTARKAMVDKYDVAVIKRNIEFSKATYTEAYNKFSQFVSSCKTIDDVNDKAAEFGFMVQDYQRMANSVHYVAGLRGTREALKWIFDAKEKQVSPLYECGNNDCLLVVALSKINKKGYADWESQKDYLKAEVLREKKFEQLSKKFDGVKTLADAAKQGARLDTVPHITFSAPVYIMATGGSEPALNGAVAATNQGEFSKKVVKGNAGAYVFQVVEKKQRENAQFDAKSQAQTVKMQSMQGLNRVFGDLVEKAEIVDNRYLFF